MVFALGAAGLYGLGNALEHREVVDTEADGRLHVGLLGRLARRPLWVLGMFGDIGAYGFQAAALAYGSLLVVQPLLVCGLLVALPLNARWTRRRIRRSEWVAAFLIEASPSGGTAHAPFGDWVQVGGSIAALIVLAIMGAARTHGHVRAALLGFAAGALFGDPRSAIRCRLTDGRRQQPGSRARRQFAI
jgi:drug/metabolite transporter (DMT)-like permease